MITFAPAGRSASVADAVTPTSSLQPRPRWGVVEWFVISQTAIPALFFIPGTQAIRIPLRVAPFALSLSGLALLLLRPSPRFHAHPARRWLLASVAWTALMVFHPNTNSAAAGLGQVLLYLAVAAPLLWVPGFIRDDRHLLRLLWLTAWCSFANSVMAILQYLDPQRWLPRQLSTAFDLLPAGLSTVMLERLDGSVTVRPTGLSDTPGAVAVPAFLAAFLGLALYARCRRWHRGAALLISLAGFITIFLSQVRSALIMTLAALVMYVSVLIRRQLRSALAVVGLALLFAASALTFLSLRGERSTIERFSSLVGADPLAVYERADRAPQLTRAIRDLVPRYPLGAGLGRWGQMRLYFGDEANRRSPPIYAEIELPAMVLDGGIVLVALYGTAMLVTFRANLRIARHGHPANAAIVLALGAGIAVLVFSYTPFTAPVGLQFWLFAGALHGAQRSNSRPAFLPGR